MKAYLNNGLASEDWHITTLGECAEILMGQSPPGETYNVTGSGVPLLNGPAEFGRKFPTAVQWTTSPTRMANIGDILFCVRGNTTGRMNLADKPYCIGRGLAAVSGKPSKAETSFVSFQLEFIKSAIYSVAVGGGSTFPNISRGSLLEFEVPAPPLAEQRKIAGILELVHQAIEQQVQLLELTAALKRTLLDQLFTQGLRGEPQKQTEIGLVPESWDVVELVKAVEQIDYGFSAPIPKTAPENGVKIVSTADITKDGLLLYGQIRRIKAPEKTVKRLTLQTGDVLFNWRNSAELIGKSAVFEEQDEPHVFASFILRIKCGGKKSHNFFLAHLMNHFRKKGVFLQLARRAVNQANYNRNEISVLKIPLPTYQEQREIADTIRVVDTKILHHQQKKKNLEDLFRTLLHQLMTAQIRVNNLDLPELEAAAAE